MDQLQVVERGTPLSHASKALILLHGRGGSALDILQLAHYFCDETFYIAAPQAKNQSWYPQGFMSPEASNQPWLALAMATIHKLVDEISKSIPQSNIYLMGFSQGANLSLEFAATNPATYGGIIAFSGGLMGPTLDASKYKGPLNQTKIFIGVSSHDPFIPLQRSEASATLLKTLGAEVTLHSYPANTHIVTNDEINWVQKNIFLL